MIVFGLAAAAGRPDRLYAGGFGGVFASPGGAPSWSGSTAGLSTTNVYALATAGVSTVYAGTDQGVFRSADGGTSWALAASGLDGAQVVSLAIDPATPSTIYAGSTPTYFGNGIYTGGGIYKSLDGAGSWQSVSLAGYTVYSFALDPANTSTLYAATNIGVFESTDSGNNWTTVQSALTGQTVSALAISAGAADVLYATTAGGAFYRSTDGAVTWSAAGSAPSGASVQALVVAPDAPKVLFAGTSAGVLTSADAGATWSFVNDGLATLFVQSLAIDPRQPSTLFAGTYGGSVFALPLTASPPRSNVRVVAPRQ